MSRCAREATDNGAVKSNATGAECRLGFAVIPVADFNSTGELYGNLVRRVDDGLEIGGLAGIRSKASVGFGTAMQATSAGALDRLLLALENLDRALGELIPRGGGRERSAPAAPWPAPSRGEWL